MGCVAEFQAGIARVLIQTDRIGSRFVPNSVLRLGIFRVTLWIYESIFFKGLFSTEIQKGGFRKDKTNYHIR